MPCSGRRSIRGAAIMLCLLPPTRMALGHSSRGELPDASALFNLMRNLGGAIGIALIDTVIWSRAPDSRGRALERLRAGDLEAARTIGIPEAYLAGPLPSADDPIVQAFVRPLRRAGRYSCGDQRGLGADRRLRAHRRPRGGPVPPLVPGSRTETLGLDVRRGVLVRLSSAGFPGGHSRRPMVNPLLRTGAQTVIHRRFPNAPPASPTDEFWAVRSHCRPWGAA